MNARLAIVLGLLLSPPVHADFKQLKKIDARIEKQKYAAAIRLTRKGLEEEGLTWQQARLLKQRLGEAKYLQLVIEPNPVRIEMFIKQFPHHKRMVDARNLLAGIAFEDAQEIGTEAAYLGVTRTFKGTPGAVSARAAAARLAKGRLRADATPDELRAFRLRYGGEDAASDAQSLEDKAAIELARTRASADVWQAFIDRYPDHPDIDEALKQLHQLSWENVDSTASSAEELWAYASQFPDTEQGWMAAEKALSKSLAYTHPERKPVGAIDVDLGGVPPPGWTVELAVEVQAGEEWVPWAEAVTAWSKRVGGVEPPPAKGRTDVQRTVDRLTWSTPYALCSTTKTPVEARIRTTMTSGERTRSWEHAFQVAARCSGAERLVFLAHPDDIIGPFGTAKFDVLRQRYNFEKSLIQAPDHWNCSHVSTVDRMGATLVCGLSTVRFGWKANEIWFRPTDVDKATTTRVEMAAPKVDKRLGVRSSSGRLLERSGRSIASLKGRTAALTPLMLEEAFGKTFGGSDNAPPIATDMEEIRGTSIIPVPKDAEVQSVRFDSVDSPRRIKLRRALRALYGDRISLSHQIEADQKRFIFVRSPVESGAMAVIGFVVDDPEAEGGWMQFIPLPVSAGHRSSQWVSFEHNGHHYLRTVGTSPVRGRKLRVYTYRMSDQRMVVDLADRR
jgi:hypothetical protein